MISILAIGKNKDKALQMLEKEYLKRLQAFGKFSVEEFKDESNENAQRTGEAEKIKEKESQRILSKIKPDSYVILLDLAGREYTSEEFAKKYKAWHDQKPNLVFVIAGSLGPSKELRQRADEAWKLSDLTFTHLMARVLMLEQIYRANMINAGRNYHK